MKVEDLGMWLFYGYREHVIRGQLTPVEWENIAQSARDDWTNFAKVHSKVFRVRESVEVSLQNRIEQLVQWMQWLKHGKMERWQVEDLIKTMLDEIKIDSDGTTQPNDENHSE